MKRLDLVSLRRKGYLSGFPMSISWSYGDEPTGSIGLHDSRRRPHTSGTDWARSEARHDAGSPRARD